MAFDTMTIDDASYDVAQHDNLDICACAMCANGSEDEWGVDGIYNVAYESQSPQILMQSSPRQANPFSLGIKLARKSRAGM